MSDGLIAALDVGKTHTRLSFVDPAAGLEVWSARRVNQSITTTLGRGLDVAGIERWLVEAFASAPARERVSAIVPIAHGAAAVLIGHDGEVLAAPDYEEPRFERINTAYELERDPFERSFSPRLPLGLNLGRQLFYLQYARPELFEHTAHILLYPQFWAWRLSGVMASEVTSLGCHSDLWLPQAKEYSALALRQGWATRFPAIRFAGEVLGSAQGPLAQAAQVPQNCRVLCGIHDSSASYLRYLLGRQEEPFTAISSGTWTVLMANKAPLENLRNEPNMNGVVDAFGSPVATARFMGGRQYEAIARTAAQPTLEAAQSVIRARAMAVPGEAVRIIDGEALNDAERASLATLYIALQANRLLERLGTQGEIIVDGPLASNPLFAGLLAQLRPQSAVYVDDVACVTSAIAYLAGVGAERVGGRRAEALKIDALGEHGRACDIPWP